MTQNREWSSTPVRHPADLLTHVASRCTTPRANTPTRTPYRYAGCAKRNRLRSPRVDRRWPGATRVEAPQLLGRARARGPVGVGSVAFVPQRPSGVVTFLFTDIEGSTRRWESDPEAMRGALAAHDEVLRNAIEARGGW